MRFLRLFRQYMFPSVAQTFLSATLCFICSLSLFAQDIRVRATLDTTALRIGEQTLLRLTVEHPVGIQVQFPSPLDTLSKHIEIVQRSGIDSSVENGRAVQNQTYTITSFDEGLHDIPALTVKYRKPGDTEPSSIQTQVLTLTVQSVRVDTTQQNARDIKPPMEIERTFIEIVPYLLIALVVLAAIGGGIYYWRKRKTAPSEEIRPREPELPPYQVAMKALEELQSERLWQQGATKEYYSRLADILRIYVEKTYHITTLEATTDEIMRQFLFAAAPSGASEMLRLVLQKADMVKFARYEPLPDEYDRSFKAATEFVTVTTLKTAAPEDSTLTT